MIDTLYVLFLHKYVSFVVCVDITPDFSDKVSQNPYLWGVYRHSSQKCKIFKLLYSQNYSRESSKIFDNDKYLQVLFVYCPNLCPTNPRWRMAAITKKMKNCYISVTDRFL